MVSKNEHLKLFDIPKLIIISLGPETTSVNLTLDDCGNSPLFIAKQWLGNCLLQHPKLPDN
jgi:hypothetical protein